MADDDWVSRAEFTALSARVSALEASRPTPTGPDGSGGTGPTRATGPTGSTGAPGPTPGAGEVKGEVKGGVLLPPVTVTTTPGRYDLSATLRAEQDSTLRRAQIVVRGPNGTDLAHLKVGSLGLTAGQSHSMTGSARGVGTYQTWAAWSPDDLIWFEGPKTTFTVAADPSLPAAGPTTQQPTQPSQPSQPDGKSRVRPRGKSQMPYNSLVFRNYMSEAKKFAAWRGVDVDGLLFFTPRQSWDDLRKHAPDHRPALEAGYMIITTMPHAPESEGDSMNERGANDAYKNQQRDLGKWMADNGYNREEHVVRVDWEGNGDWYKWSANRKGGPDALKKSIINFVNNIRAGGCTKVKFDLCWNKGPSQSKADFEYFPGAEWIDIVAVDQYDMWGPTFSESDWKRELSKKPSIGSVIDLAKKHGIQWAVDEGGNTHGNGGSAYGKDNPKYWEYLHQTIMSNLDTLSHHVTYDEKGAPASLRHDFASNPEAAKAYKRLWRP